MFIISAGKFHYHRKQVCFIYILEECLVHEVVGSYSSPSGGFSGFSWGFDLRSLVPRCFPPIYYCCGPSVLLFGCIGGCWCFHDSLAEYSSEVFFWSHFRLGPLCGWLLEVLFFLELSYWSFSSWFLSCWCSFALKLRSCSSVLDCGPKFFHLLSLFRNVHRILGSLRLQSLRCG